MSLKEKILLEATITDKKYYGYKVSAKRGGYIHASHFLFKEPIKGKENKYITIFQEYFSGLPGNGNKEITFEYTGEFKFVK